MPVEFIQISFLRSKINEIGGKNSAVLPVPLIEVFRVLHSFCDQDESGRQLSSSLEAIRNAIEPGVSRYQDGNGMSFPSLLHALADLWRTARIRSGEAGLLIDRTEDQRKRQICLPCRDFLGFISQYVVPSTGLPTVRFRACDFFLDLSLPLAT
jgi:hypothetical protein